MPRLVRAVVEVSARTRGREKRLDPPDGGWGYLPLDEGRYLVTVCGPQLEEAETAGVSQESGSPVQAAAQLAQGLNAGWQSLAKAYSEQVEQLNSLLKELRDREAQPQESPLAQALKPLLPALTEALSLHFSSLKQLPSGG